MINRELKTVQVISFADTVDSYGQKRKGTSSSRDTEMVLKIYQQSNVQDPRYVDVTTIGLTKDLTITTANQIIDGNDVYDVLYIIPSNRLTQILMKRV